MKYQVILFQAYLRRFVINFGRYTPNFEFIHTVKPPSVSTYAALPEFEREVRRTKTHWRNRLRRFLGIPNIRPYFSTKGDLLFTYGTLVLTWKPYCTYIETGHALYNYDIGITRNPWARFLVSFFATRKNCKRLIFLSEAGKRSFFSTVTYSPKIRTRLEAKSIVIYPIPIEKRQAEPRRYNGELRLLFPGTFYIKGGTELWHAFSRLRAKHPNVTLTIITALHMLRPEDRKALESTTGLTLLDAKLNEREMIQAYQEHDVFLLPTYREGFGLVLIEALAYGMPIIGTDQYATKEMIRDGYNGFLFPDHPLKDYNPETYELFGKYYNPSDFYRDLFAFQKNGKMKPIEDFIVDSVEKLLSEPELLEEYSRNSLSLYKEKFDADDIGRQMEAIFSEAVSRR